MELLLLRSLETKVGDDENAVKGLLVVSGKELFVFDTLENLLYLCNEGNYILKFEFSPKFKTHLWELYGTGLRREMKIHEGYESKHSRGCVLMGSNSIDSLHSILNTSEVYKVRIVNI